VSDDVLTVVSLKSIIFCDVTLFNLLEVFFLINPMIGQERTNISMNWPFHF
jgi:hypothetical protein